MLHMTLSRIGGRSHRLLGRQAKLDAWLDRLPLPMEDLPITAPWALRAVSSKLKQCCAYRRLIPKCLLLRFVTATESDRDGNAINTWAVPDVRNRLPVRLGTGSLVSY